METWVHIITIISIKYNRFRSSNVNIVGAEMHVITATLSYGLVGMAPRVMM